VDTDLHLWENSIIPNELIDSGSHFDLARIINLASKYTPSLALPVSLAPEFFEDPVAIYTNYLVSLQPRFSKGAFQDIAAFAAKDVTIPDSVLDVDDSTLLTTGSIFDCIQLKQAINKPNRFNAERCERIFSDDPNYSTLMELASVGAIIDVDPQFVPQSIPEEFRHSEVRLSKVFQAHALDSWTKSKGLLLRMSTLEETNQLSHLHFNSNHLVCKLSDPLSRWCIDPSHRSDDNLPLNGGTAKELSIKRYQKTWVATLVEMLTAVNNRRTTFNLPWNRIWIFKEDIKACFPQMDMAPESAVLLAMRITAVIIFIHLAGSFGWTGAPMAWSIIGAAMLRICTKLFAPSVDLFLICDDFVGFGLKDDTMLASIYVCNLINDVCGPNSVSIDKHVHSQRAEVIGWLIDFCDSVLGASLRPKDDAIAKMCYYFNSFDLNQPQPLILWQILHSFAERYSQGLRGMRPFVSGFAHMIRATGPNPTSNSSHNLHITKHKYPVKKTATASTKFAIDMWRIVCYLLFRNPSAFSISIPQFLSLNGAGNSGIEFDSVSDASPYRICAAIYHHNSKTLIGWTSVLLPFPRDTHNRYQTNREYIGLLVTFFLLAFSLPDRVNSTAYPPIVFKWINDNKGALVWADNNKTSSLPSILSNTVVTSFQLLTNISLAGSEHLPGIEMGDIDRESRREDHLAQGNTNYAPSLLPHLYVDIESNPLIMKIIKDCSPFNPPQHKVNDFHQIFLEIQSTLRVIFPTTPL